MSALDEPTPAEPEPDAQAPPADPSLWHQLGRPTRLAQLAWVRATAPGVWRDRAMVALLACLVYLPFLGSFGLWDPWETHYGEVGRQITERNDWISTWWGAHWQDAGGDQEGRYFFSKPILLMWLMAMGLTVFGYNEFAIRIGVCLVAVLALVLVYSMGREVFTRRAGWLMAGVLGGSPFFYMLSRQAQTDMPFVGLMTIGLCFFMMAVFGRRREEVADRLSYGLTLGWVGLVTVPQISLVLVGLSRWRGGPNPFMRQVTASPMMVVVAGGAVLVLAALVLGAGLALTRGGHDPQAESFWRRHSLWRWGGAALGVAWAPLLAVLIGALVSAPPGGTLRALEGWFVWGPIQAALYASCLGFALVMTVARPDVRRRRLYLFTFYVFIGLATLAKGLLGFLLPGAVLFFYILLTREWRMLREVELVRGGPIFIAVTFPWYAAMLVRHTHGFWNRFFIHDHFKRLASGVHQVDEGSFEHFARWLGYGLFPWSGFVPAALARVLAGPGLVRPDDDRSRATLMLLLWVVISFALFTLSSTKFHHYIFPVVPPLAMLVALTLEDALEGEWARPWPLYLVGVGLIGALSWDLLADNQLLKNLFTYKYERVWYNVTWDRAYLMAILAASAPMLAGAALLLWRHRLVRRAGLGLLFLGSVVLAYFALDYYMPILSKTWSQKGLWDAYYAQCERVEGPPGAHPAKRFCRQPIIAYKLNWRGETFYSQNEVIPIRDDDDFEHFLAHESQAPFYGIMEMARYRGEFKRKLPARLRGKTCLTYNRNDKFVLVKAPCAPDDPHRLEP